MIPRNVISIQDVAMAAATLINQGVKNNATKYVVPLRWQGKTVQVAPKRLISEAFRVATGEAHSVKKFSGGAETNRFLEKLGLSVDLKQHWDAVEQGLA